MAYYKCYREQDAASLSGVITNAHFIVMLSEATDQNKTFQNLKHKFIQSVQNSLGFGNFVDCKNEFSDNTCCCFTAAFNIINYIFIFSNREPNHHKSDICGHKTFPAKWT